MFNGWFCLGGEEIINNTRAEDYARTSPCGINWFNGPYCRGLPDRLESPAYVYDDIDQAPWYDPDIPNFAATEFLGVYCISVDGLDDDTTEATGTERVTGGAVIGRQRDRSRQMRFRVVLTAASSRGLEYGRSWLANLLRESTCSVHSGGSCGTSSLTFMTQCPPVFVNDGGGYMAYLAAQDIETRILHGVKCTTGLIKEQEFNRADINPIFATPEEEGGQYRYPSGAWGGIYEFTLTAEQPRMFSLPRIRSTIVTGQTLIQDEPFNLFPQPSAELASGTVTVATNYALNPSVEVNLNDWATIVGGTAILIANVAGSRSNELAAAGLWSRKNLWTAPGANAGPVTDAYFGSQQEVVLPGAVVAGERYSISMWTAASIQAGAPVLGALDVVALWRAGGSTLREDLIGTITGGSGVASTRSIIPPLGATSVIVRSRQFVTSWNAGTIIRQYTDALAVTNP